MLAQRYYSVASFSDESDEFIFRPFSFFRGEETYKFCGSSPLSSTRAREIVLNAFVSIGLLKHDYGLHSPRTGGASATANARVADRLFKRHGRCKSDKAKDDFIKDDIQPLFSVSLIVLEYFNFLFPVLLVRTRLVLTHPNYGCSLHGNVSHSFERGSELEHK